MYNIKECVGKFHVFQELVFYDIAQLNIYTIIPKIALALLLIPDYTDACMGTYPL